MTVFISFEIGVLFGFCTYAFILATKDDDDE